MAAGSTYEKIATNTLLSNTSTVTFNDIPSTYTDLVIIFSGKCSPSTDAKVRLGSSNTPDTGNNYSRHFMFGYSGGMNPDTVANLDGFIFSPYNENTNAIIHINSYANPNMYKPALIRNGPKPVSGDNLTYVSANIWRSLAVINCIQITAGANSFVTGSVFSIYGIAAA